MDRRLSVVTALLVAGLHQSAPRADPSRLDAALRARARAPHSSSQVIIRTVPDLPIDEAVRRAGGVTIRSLGGSSVLASIPDRNLEQLAASRGVASVSADRLVISTAVVAGRARASVIRVPQALGVDGCGVGVATIDSGISAAHDTIAAGRVVHWMDFVSHLEVPYDDYGHGTHVAGIIAASDSGGDRRGVAPGASLIVLKALDGTGSGRVSDVIAAVDYAIANRDRFNIRVINLSVAASVYESYHTDPLAQAALRAVRAGIVVVAAAGNFGRTPTGETQMGSIAAPGNAPWVLTVGASDDRATPDPADDVVAAFSSRGPTAIDGLPKPDLIAPGVGIEAAADPASTLFALQPQARAWDDAHLGGLPSLSMSGTSMAAPVVAGTVALIAQAAPGLTPNAIKAILEFTAQPRAGEDDTAQGTGLLNIRGAVALARQVSMQTDNPVTLEAAAGGTRSWSRRIIWGVQRLTGEVFTPVMRAWDLDVPWGEDGRASGQPVTWGALCAPERAGCGTPR
ncbi:MAG: S8 family peptidase [Vicinamibacterales bacterium]